MTLADFSIPKEHMNKEHILEACRAYKHTPQRNEKLSVSGIGEALISTYNLKTLKDTKEIYWYHPVLKLYESSGEDIIRETVRERVDPNISNHDMTEILIYIKDKTKTDRANFDDYPGWIHVFNGWLNYQTREFKYDDPTLLSFHKIPWDYDSEATNPEQLKFFSEIFEEEDLDAVQKFFGYLLLPDNR